MTENEKRILAALEQLSEEQQEQVVEYAEFLGQRAGARAGTGETAAPAVPTPESPQPVEKDPEEGPVQAIKRLRRTYPMLDRSKLLDETTNVMTKRYLRNKPEDEVIEEIEEIFEQHYQRYLEQFQAG
ncbi:MAG TPA: Crp/Fnr family transcriptional regulator [Gammaproteobacteria bacterium]|nr:Crp/Fnr family transcriptional regulator [Gammaproteobacteria bacterium]